MRKTTNPVMSSLIRIIAVLALVPSLALAAAGDLDYSFARFGINGVVSLGGMSARDMAVTSGGKILVVGSNGPNLIIRRLHPNGDLDLTFGINGQVSMNLGGDDPCGDPSTSPYSCGITARGNTFAVVAESSSGDNNDFAVLYFWSDGELNVSWGANGFNVLDFDGRRDYANDVAFQQDGKIVVLGSAEFGSNDVRFAVARFDHDGALDSSFSGDGKQNISFGNQSGTRFHQGNAIAIQSDGKIVLAGRGVDYGAFSANSDFGIARLNTDGSLDTSFSDDGKKRVGFADTDIAYDVEIATDGKIVVVGGASASNLGKQYAVARLNSDGSLDNTFSDDGRLLLNQVADVEETLIAAALQPDGKIVATGHVDTDIQMVRFNPEGLLDPSFTNTGIYTHNTSGLARDLIIQPGGNYLLLYSDEIVRLNPDLTHASTNNNSIQPWNTEGTVVTNFGNGDERAYGLTMQRDGKAIVIGDSKPPNSANTKMGIARYNPDGTLDRSFGQNGMQLVGPTGDAFGRSAVALNNGKILVGGFSRSNPSADLRCALFRLNPDGSNDDTFSLLGIHTSIGGDDDICVKVLVQEDDKIILVGYAKAPVAEDLNRYGIALVRYHPSGQLDTSFNGSGMVVTLLGSNATTRSRNALLQPDGKILVSGTHSGDMLVMRYNSNGTLDSSFGTGGIVVADHGGVVESLSTAKNQTAASASNLIDISYGLGFIYQGHIAAGGLVDGVDFGILFLTPDGARCTVCGPIAETHYWRTVDLGFTEAAYGFAIQDNGRMVLTGGESSGDSGVLGARIKRNPSFRAPPYYTIDTAFNLDGKVQHTSKYRTSARANALYGSGIFVAGYRFNGHDDDFFLMRLENDSDSWPFGVNLLFVDGFED